MEKRALLAVILSLLVLFIFQAYFTPPEKPVSPQLENEDNAGLSSPENLTGGSEEKKASPYVPPSHTLSTVPETEIRVETPLYTAIFSTQGATLKSWVLKKYLDQLGAEGKHVEMVTSNDPRERPLSLTLIGEKNIETLTTYFSANQDLLNLTEGKDKDQLIFTGTTPEGFSVKKIFTFSLQSYVVDIRIEVYPPSSSFSHKGAVLSWVRKVDPEKDGSQRFGFTGPATYVDGKLKEVEIKKLEGGDKSFSRRVSWAGYEDKYFLAALFPQNGAPMSTDILRTAENAIFINCFKSALSSRSEEKAVYTYGFYSGPKDLEILRSLGRDLEKAIDFGMFDIIAKPLLYTLKYLNNVTHNYGIAIIILTIIIKILFFPLTHKSYKSMKAMKDLQPKIQALRKKYENDKEQLNRETMSLYRSYKVNPLGGCLPLLIQFPIFIAFYWVLLGSIELRHVPFMLWIKDLSAHDPYYVTPIIMGVTMFIQQKMTPTVGDPAQAKVMLAMPIVFTFMFLKFPSGLVIYWMVNNILQIFQQLYIDKRIS